MGAVSASLATLKGKITPAQKIKKQNKFRSRSPQSPKLFNQLEASRINFYFAQKLTKSYSRHQSRNSFSQDLDQKRKDKNKQFSSNFLSKKEQSQQFFPSPSKVKKSKFCQDLLPQPLQQSIFWIANNVADKNQKFYIKQINKNQLINNHRVQSVHLQLDIFKGAPFHYGGEFVNKLIFAFQDYQYLYMVQQFSSGFTLEKVIKNHFFTQQQTKYIVAALIYITQYINSKGYALCQLTPQHILITKDEGKLKLLQIVNPILIDQCYPYTMITEPCIYSAPQVLARDQILAQSDYYSIGMMMYEMMTQKVIRFLTYNQSCVIIQDPQSEEEKISIRRNDILCHQIDIKKYNLPQGWNPQAADFLLKLLVKNPQFRLGRYGSFQLKSHPWLRNYNWDTLANKHGLNLHQKYFDKQFQSQKSAQRTVKLKTTKVNQKINNDQQNFYLNFAKKKQFKSNGNINSQLQQQENRSYKDKRLPQSFYNQPMQKTTKFIKLFENYKFSNRMHEEDKIQQHDTQQQNDQKRNWSSLNQPQAKQINDRVSISEKYRDENNQIYQSSSEGQEQQINQPQKNLSVKKRKDSQQFFKPQRKGQTQKEKSQQNNKKNKYSYKKQIKGAAQNSAIKAQIQNAKSKRNQRTEDKKIKVGERMLELGSSLKQRQIQIISEDEEQ